MAVHPRFTRLVEISAPYWAGEAEVARTYFNSPDRNAETDRQWLARQCYKEYWGSGFADPALGLLGDWSRGLQDMLPQLDTGLDRRVVLDHLEQMHAEYDHYCMFAEIWDALAPEGTGKLTPNMLANWPEGEALDQFRIKMRADHGDLGVTALRFTEGGYCTLYSEGAKLTGRGGTDEMIGAACKKVYDDEYIHLLRGIAGINDADLDDGEWEKLEELVVAQLRMRITMRNGQFGRPLSDERIAAIHNGDIDPIEFDYEKAQLAA